MKEAKRGLSLAEAAVVPRLAVVSAGAVCLSSRLTKEYRLRLPFIASPMDSVTDDRVAVTLGRMGALGVVHRYYPKVADQASAVSRVASDPNESGDTGARAVAALISLDDGWEDHAASLVDHGMNVVALDSLHSVPHRHLSVIERIKKRWPRMAVISGNTVHQSDCLRLISAGADCIRVGWSAASINNGRGLLGMGRAQATSIMECSRACAGADIPVIADGGIRSAGDIAVALALGANTVMLGKVLAMCEDSPAAIVEENNVRYKVYRGMSRDGTISQDLVSEGTAARLPVDVPIAEKIRGLARNLRAAISAGGCESLEQFRTCAEVEFLTESGRFEAASWPATTSRS